MKIQFVPRNPSISIVKNGFHSGCSPISSQVAPRANRCSEELVSKILSRKWTLMSPETKIHQIMLSVPPEMNGQCDKFENILFSNNSHPSLGESVMRRNNGGSSFYIIHDDLLHPLVNGNKARKLDALFPLIEDHAVTDVVTCGGCQSAHAAAVAVLCAERGLKSHLLLRGERPQVLTGYTLISMLYGNVSYIPRTLYANRKEMLTRQADSMAGSSGSVVWLSDLFVETPFTNYTSANPYLQPVEDNVADNRKKIVIVNEGAGDAIALLGMIRLMQYLSSDHLFGKKQPLRIVVDAGTGTTAVGLGIGALCLGLPWEVTAVMLADTIDNYIKQEERLIYEFCKSADLPCIDEVLNGKNSRLVHWVERHSPRKFGNVMKGEIERCQQIARQTGVLVDPVYTLAAWELATQLSLEEREGGAKVVMLHTGGTLSMFGLAQRYKSYF